LIIRFTTTIDVDAVAWAEEFGIQPSAHAVREDVQTYFKTIVDGQLNDVLNLGAKKWK
jgi:hypothetical protein